MGHPIWSRTYWGLELSLPPVPCTSHQLNESFRSHELSGSSGYITNSVGRPIWWRATWDLERHIQPVPWKMRLEMVIGMQNEILIGIKKLPFYKSFQIFKGKETWINSFMIPIRISFCIPMTISSLIFHGTGCTTVPCTSHQLNESSRSHELNESCGYVTNSVGDSIFSRTQWVGWIYHELSGSFNMSTNSRRSWVP